MCLLGGERSWRLTPFNLLFFPTFLTGENLVPEQAGEGEEDQQEEASAGAAWRHGASQPRHPAAGSRSRDSYCWAGPCRSAVTAARGHRRRDCWRSRPRWGQTGPGPGRAVGAAPHLPMHYSARGAGHVYSCTVYVSCCPGEAWSSLR